MGYPSVHGGSGFAYQHKVVEADFPRQPNQRTLFPQVYSLELARKHRLEWFNRMEDMTEHTRRLPLSPLLPGVLWTAGVLTFIGLACVWMR